MCSIAEMDSCPYYDLCMRCHPEPEMNKKRQSCSSENCDYCAVYWAFVETYHILEEKDEHYK